nr:hypothetical protein CFP56_24426 [Quercus suber]
MALIGHSPLGYYSKNILVHHNQVALRDLNDRPRLPVTLRRSAVRGLNDVFHMILSAGQLINVEFIYRNLPLEQTNSTDPSAAPRFPYRPLFRACQSLASGLDP